LLNVLCIFSGGSITFTIANCSEQSKEIDPSSCLPEQDGITLEDLQSQLIRRGIHQKECRPALLLEALRHLQFAGLVATTANQPGEQFVHRRYWRAATSDVQQSQAIWPQKPLTA